MLWAHTPAADTALTRTLAIMLTKTRNQSRAVRQETREPAATGAIQRSQATDKTTYDAPVTVDLAIRAHGVTKSYGQVHALRGLDLEVSRGECVCLLGPNGAGKTVTTEILEGYRKRDAGVVEVLGHDPNHADRVWKSKLGIVLQNARDLSDLTVLESVRHFAAYYPNAREPEEVIDAVGLTQKTDAKGSQMSGGQRRRLDVALGILGRPEVLFLDEPTTGFDPEARRQFWELIEALKSEGTTILLTTHYLDEAQRLADRVAVISRGRVLATDTPSALGNRQRALAVVQWLEAGVEHRQETPSPTKLILELAARLGPEIPELSVVRPTLEDVYMKLTSDDERDDETEGDQ